MKVIHEARQLPTAGRKVCLAIGVFDGVHLGHQQIIRQTVADARQCEGIALVVTFDKHPNAIIAPDHAPPLIYSRSQKLRAIASLGADALLEIQFDDAFRQAPGEQFIRNLAHDLGRLQSICVGADFVFGYKRSGNVALLRTIGAALHFQVHGLAAVALDGQVVSSTRIREAIQVGDFDAASQMLGRSYALASRVTRGDQLGRKLGFPTANLDTSGLLLPPNGVYAAQVIRRSGIAPVTPHNSTPPLTTPADAWRKHDVTRHRAVVNIGHRPSIHLPTLGPRMEVHLLDFTGDLYGQDLEVAFTSRLREERKFASLDELKSQISRDIAEARSRL